MNATLSKEVFRIINKWDPLELIPLTSQKEYEFEVEEILHSVNPKMSINQIEGILDKVFIDYFEELYDPDPTSRREAAESLYQLSPAPLFSSRSRASKEV
jgi:hypothetical protein